MRTHQNSLLVWLLSRFKYTEFFSMMLAHSFIVDRIFMHDTLSRNPLIIEKANGVNHIERLWLLYRTTHPTAYIIDSAIPTPAGQKYNTYYQYPYSSMQVMVQNENRGQGLVQIRTNYN